MDNGLSQRLQACLNLAAPYKIIADIGTDHAYLPCAGIKNNKLTKAIAADIGAGPLQSARHTVDRYGLHHEIELRLGPGLSVLQPGEVEAVVIAGMGGKLIASILGADPLLTRSFPRLVLQPNVDGVLVRKWLFSQGYEILDEELILEDGKFYEVIAAQAASEPVFYDELDAEFGPILRRRKDLPAFQEKWGRALSTTEKILAGLPEGHPGRAVHEHRKAQIKEAASL